MGIEGIKIGLELHQRLTTKNKLFCSCSTKGNEEKTRELRRKLHAVPSELGQVDPAALFESKKAPLHRYDFYKDTCCLVETDDEPPHEMNKEAILLGLMICNMFEAEIVDEIHVMRKTVIDGSNTSGFQRTAIFGMNGKLRYEINEENIKENNKDTDIQEKSEKEIGIQTIAIEEE
ncbi:MAG: Glu-tRNA(Gln) amidotransferase GatDE subunit E, partial [Candidatus Micrarchaeia archaeon]